ncbi:MAG: FAD-dependent oxidoreductase [Ruminococcaceae bacterium]|nr:FAD-dependent oxidoreductase [Oscillospiraceae bacterium]
MNKEIKIWIDALEFERGGWKEDTQFVHLMGCGYLIAANEPGVPVEDAKIEVDLPQKDIYRIWVRDRNWLRPHNPGKFSLLVNGEDNGVVLGAQPSDAWVWEIAGDFELCGKTELTVRDLTGYFGRFSSIVITNDFDYVPSRETERMYKERARAKGLDTDVRYGGDYDVIVVGGGPGGVPAAIASARKGMKTLLIHNRPVLGGNGSSEIGITFEGAGSHGIRETGIAEELRRLRDSDPMRAGDWQRALEKLVAAEKNITVVYNSHVCDVEMESESRIKGVIALDILELTKKSYTGRIFIDCTGDAWVGYYAGAKYRFGREAKHEYGEYLASDIADTQTMSGCIRDVNRQILMKTASPVSFKAPDWVPKLPEKDEDFGRSISAVTRQAWWIEAPNTYDDMWDGEESRDALFLVLLGYFDHLKNYWSGKAAAENVRLCFTSIMNGRRESRRLIGDYVLTQDDCINGTQFEDVISYTGWNLDIHHPEGIYGSKNGPLYCARRVHNSAEVPFRCLYSKNIDNLMFAGRNISTTHIAMGTTRVQNTIATLGQAVGTAAAMCIRLGETPRGIYQRHIGELQQTLLKDDQYIPRIRREDHADPCLGAKVSASSVCTTEIFRTAKGEVGELLPMNVARAVNLGYSETHGDIEHIYLRLRSDLAEEKTVRIHAQPFGGDSDTFAAPGEIYTVESVVPPMREGWVRFDVHIPTKRDKYVEAVRIRIELDEAEGISWRSITNGTMYQSAGEKDADGNWRMKLYVSMCASVSEPYEPAANCAPENVVNGYNRIVDSERYEWVSDPEQELPQWIEVELSEPREIKNVNVCFDTDLVNPGVAWGIKIAEAPKCVKDYTVEIFDGKSWRKIADEKDNIFRKRTHSFEPMNAEKIKVTALATWGDRSARIMEISAN